MGCFRPLISGALCFLPLPSSVNARAWAAGRCLPEMTTFSRRQTSRSICHFTLTLLVDSHWVDETALLTCASRAAQAGVLVSILGSGVNNLGYESDSIYVYLWKSILLAWAVGQTVLAMEYITTFFHRIIERPHTGHSSDNGGVCFLLPLCPLPASGIRHIPPKSSDFVTVFWCVKIRCKWLSENRAYGACSREYDHFTSGHRTPHTFWYKPSDPFV